MDARDGHFTVQDYGKIIARKFLRLAVPYYLMWLVLWGINSRFASGYYWH